MKLAWSILFTLGLFIVFGAVIEAMRRRGFDPVGSLARMISPDAAQPEAV